MGRRNDCCAGRPTALRREERTRSSRAIQQRPLVNTNERTWRNVPSDKNVNRDARPSLRLCHTGGCFWRTVLGTRSVGFRRRRVRCLPFYDSQEAGPSQARRQRLAGRIPAKRAAVRPILAVGYGIALSFFGLIVEPFCLPDSQTGPLSRHGA